MLQIDREQIEEEKSLVQQQKLMRIQAFAGLTESLMGLVSESSSAYAALYAVQKSFNLAQAIMNGYTAISAAWASAPFPYNMPAVAMATVESGVLQAAIQAVSPVGMAHNGIDNIPREGTWLLDGGERVLNPQQNTDLTRYLADQKDTNRMAKGQLDAIQSGANLQAERQAQANAKVQAAQPSVNLNPNFVIVDERESLSDYLFSPDGTKAFVKFFKRNRSTLGI